MGEDELRKMAVPAKQVHRTLKDDFSQKSLEESIIEAKKKLEQNQNLENILSRLEAANADDEEVNELDPSIFNYYKGRQDQQ
jgi:CCR4-NOT transcriptional regulation complex NOT5 subunit